MGRDDEQGRMILLCEICSQPIASFNPDEAEYPLKEEMFRPVGQGHMHPFKGQKSWEHFNCPYCRFSPFAISDTGQSHPMALFTAIANDGTRETIDIKGVANEQVQQHRDHTRRKQR